MPHYEYLYEFRDPDGDRLGVNKNNSFGYPSITIYIEDADDPENQTNGVRMNLDQAKEYVAFLTKLIEEA